ncbi:uncharacterized protein LOC110826247 isoform X1 [Carica papaya]|uniref:uncharacterized protein LOC110826247 isoform X1 n=1 Tax=Carica papaya TaxID=3649 RepID=UPI000B8CA606|nr:uncharacterized protein LOC110826247 isoform X1 [Carica papaya]XP_021912551.1 uncharacterized protein LOC110826247 isoform X1 [Carica papaya]
MEERLGKGDLQVNVVRQSSLRQGSFKSTFSGRSTPRNSPSFRKVHSSRTPRREARSSGGFEQWFRSNRLIYWLLLITLWAYLGFYVQSRWAHGNNKERILSFGGNPRNEISNPEENKRQDLIANSSLVVVKNGTSTDQVAGGERINVVLAKKGNGLSHSSKTPKKRTKRAKRNSRSRMHVKQKETVEVEGKDVDGQEQDIPKKNTTYGLLVGPFASIEDRILEWSPEKRSGTCDRKGDFARLVWSRKFVLIFHELSMTGAPISMMELTTELLSCGATVSAVVLSKKGGLMQELARRRIKVVEDRADLSFKTAMKADLVIAGSAVCASWIDQYIAHFHAGGSQIAWWIMENRREYFDRSKLVLHRVKMVIFLSELQTNQWLTWCEEENIKLRSQPAIVPLSVNDELAYVAGITCSLNTPTFTPENMLEKRKLLRDSARREMGLMENDMLVMSLSSINAGKGQHLVLESAALLFGKGSLQIGLNMDNSTDNGKDQSTLAVKHHLRGLLQKLNGTDVVLNEQSISRASHVVPDENNTNKLGLSSRLVHFNDMYAVSFPGSPNGRKLLSNKEMEKQALKILIGSVGSKSNKVPYVKEILRYLSKNTNLSKSVLWTPATTRVASLYSAADVYIINSQGLGETFGRVTIEAMAFGLPVLGTDAGGTKEIVEHNVTGLLHPVGRPGTQVLAQNLQFLLENPSTRMQMGMEGRKKIERMYLKRHMYKKFVQVLYKCMSSM